MSKKKLSEMMRVKEALEAKVRQLRESRSSTGLAFLIESELEKAEVLLVAKSIVDRMQKIAEDIAKIEANDILPAMEAMKTAYGPDVADKFAATAGDTLRGAVEAITKAKDVFAGEVSNMESILNGEGPGNDMAALGPEEVAARMPQDDDASAEEAPQAVDDEMKAGEDTPDDSDDISDLENELFGSNDAGNAAGRARKESVEKRGKALGETGRPLSRSDQQVFERFRKAVREGLKPLSAARKVAETMNIDVEDVVSIVKDNSSKGARLGK